MSDTCFFTVCLFVNIQVGLEALHPIKVSIGHFTVVHLVAKPLIWSEAEGDLVVIETSI